MVKIGDELLDLLQQLQSCSSISEYARLTNTATSWPGMLREGTDIGDDAASTHLIRQSLE